MKLGSMDFFPGKRPLQKSVTRPFLSQSPYRVGSGPRGPPISPVTGFVSLGNLSRGSFSRPEVAGSLSSDGSSRESSNLPAGVVPFLAPVFFFLGLSCWLLLSPPAASEAIPLIIVEQVAQPRRRGAVSIEGALIKIRDIFNKLLEAK